MSAGEFEYMLLKMAVLDKLSKDETDVREKFELIHRYILT